MRKRRKSKKMLSIFILIIIAIGLYFFLGSAPKPKSIVWGVNFSQMHAENMGLNWRNVYSSIINDLKVKYIKLVINWDWVNGKKDVYFFDDIDWQVKKAEENNVNIVMVIGMKTGRWPECHIPAFAKNLSGEDRNTEILKYLEQMVKRYKDSPSIIAWQVENEPFFSFGECPKTDIKFLEREIRLVKSLDNTKKPVVVTDTGEFSLWWKAAKIGDIVGNTLYRKVWIEPLGFYFSSPFPPISYWLRAKLVGWIYGKKVECQELQAEPWGPVLLYNLPLKEQLKTMNVDRFNGVVAFAKKTGLDTFYFWGTEWWYWMKEKQGDPRMWTEAKKLFK